MKKKLFRLISTAFASLVIAMQLPVQVIPAHAADTVPSGKEYIWMEAEDAGYPDFYTIRTDSSPTISQNEYLFLKKDYDESVNTSITFNFNISSGGSGAYDIWVLAVAPNQNPFNPFKHSLNSGEPLKTSSDIQTSETVSTFKIDTSTFKMCWQKFYAFAQLGEGANTLTITPQKAQVNKFYSALDCVVVVPSEWGWKPSGNLAVPEITPGFQQSDTGTLWMEAENAIYPSFYAIRTDSSPQVSNNKYLFLNKNYDEATDTSIKFNFDIQNGKSGTYDIWVLAVAPNQNPFNPFKFSLNSGEQLTSKNVLTSGMVSNFKIDASSFTMCWQKFYTGTNLTEGANVLTITPQKAQVNKFYSALDCVAVVPSDWDWTPYMLNKPYSAGNISVSYEGGTLSQSNVGNKENFDVTVRNKITQDTDSDLPIYAGLMLNGEVVATAFASPAIPVSSWEVGQVYTDTLTLTVPFNAPANASYDVICGFGGKLDEISYSNTGSYAIVGTIAVGGAQAVSPYTVDISNVSVPASIQKDRQFQVSADIALSAIPEFETTPYLSLWKDGLLYAVLETETQVNAQSGKLNFHVTLTEDLPDGTYQAKIGIHKIKTAENTVQNITTQGANTVKSKNHKPMSHGFYDAKRDGTEIFWYINQNAAAFFNG